MALRGKPIPPLSVIIVAVLFAIPAVLFTVFAVAMMVFVITGDAPDVGGRSAAAGLLGAVLYWSVALGLWQGNRGARILAIVMTFLTGVLAGPLLIWVLFGPAPEAWFQRREMPSKTSETD
ncbi:hypothetical protein F8568_042440 [Actinomadura sp. LD22]|uniref:Uncharacterized protein n=1 Tax=Actinomadura physcomitrii TaxID=2650748 RepID=A0A6I4MU96_9ACTN|nr:hypothetical protein [Actinomadura physcomitrii]MWA06891.1 hypothetical protein [Actinomadura physcomitrii]